MTTTRLETDDDGRRVLLLTLDLYQRVAMGQWRDILDHCPEVTNDGPFSDTGDMLMAARCLDPRNDALRAPNASLGITAAGDNARIACDMWRALGGGMPDRSDMRLTTTPISVTTEADT